MVNIVLVFTTTDSYLNDFGRVHNSGFEHCGKVLRYKHDRIFRRMDVSSFDVLFFIVDHLHLLCWDTEFRELF